MHRVSGFCANRLSNLTEAKTIRQSMSPSPRRPQIQIGAAALNWITSSNPVVMSKPKYSAKYQ